MNIKLLIIGFVLLTILFAIGTVLYISHEDKKVSGESGEHQYAGPVPQGYDEAYYRKTGITRKLGVNVEREENMRGVPE